MTKRLGAVGIAALLVAVAIAPAPAAAQSDGAFGDLIATDGDQGLTDVAQGLAVGIASRLSSASVLSDGPTAADNAAAFQTAVNDNASELQPWINNRTDATTDVDVVAVEFTGDSSETVYLTADVSSSDYTNLSVEDTTDRSVDETCELEDHAADEAGHEVVAFTDQFASDDANVTNQYLGRMAAEYGSDVDCTFDTEAS